MSIRCFFGCHDYEPFGDGVKLLAIFERSAKIKSDALYIPESKNEIYDFLKKSAMGFFNTSSLIECKTIRDEICLRCGNIKSNIQATRKITDNRATDFGMVIRISTERQKKAKEMLHERTKMENCI
jgi:hypothetical protein